jgi:hypothetical protein
MTEGLKVTSIESLIAQSSGSLVELPPFSQGEKFVARLKRPSMMALMRAKKIPNALIVSANKMFKNGPGSLNVEDETMMDDVFQIMDVLCEAAFVEPTYQQLKEAGIQLTDDQYMFIFGYTQNGVKQLQPFRTE